MHNTGWLVSHSISQPGHALVITQWKPELALSTDPTLINLTVPDAIPTVKAIWSGIVRSSPNLLLLIVIVCRRVLTYPAYKSVLGTPCSYAILILNELSPAEEVSIGADEYDADLADDYITFVNDMVSQNCP